MSFVSLRDKFSKKGSTSKFQDIPVGCIVRATLRIEEGEKARNQVFEGLLIKKKRSQGSTSVTLRKVSFGVGVERVIPLDSVALVNLEVISQHRVRRSKLYFLRRLSGKASKLQELYGARKQDLSYLETELGPAAAMAVSAPETKDKAKEKGKETKDAKGPKKEVKAAAKPKTESPTPEAPPSEKPKESKKTEPTQS